MMRGPTALRMQDVPDGPESVDSITECLYPAGYVEGITASLHGAQGRYVGLLNMSTTDVRHPSDEARDLGFILYDQNAWHLLNVPAAG